jgi:hypothetical protein
MKKGIIICSIFLLLGSIFAEETQPIVTQTSGIALLPESKKIGDMTHTNIPYGQVVLIVPGAGMSHRIQKKHFGIELDANFVVVGLPVVCFSGSSVYYFNAKRKEGWSQGGWNITCGVGGYVVPSETIGPYFPVFAGYQGDQFFFDVGFNIVRTRFGVMGDSGSIVYAPIPSLKLGLCF